MSLKRNIIANYASQLYVTGIGIVIMPLYISYLGAEAYGLVGFFTMLQAWFSLLDMGLTPTISRETARYHGGTTSALAYRQLFRALSMVFASVALAGGILLWCMAEKIATGWLQFKELEVGEVKIAIEIIAICVALRWLCGLYRGVITGSERLVWLSVFNVLIATLRFAAVFISMGLYGFTPFVFFIHQLIVALLEGAGLFIMSRHLLPARATLHSAIGWSFKPVRAILRFALTIAFTSSVWVFVTQTDKLVLSAILPLSEYGVFTLAVLVANGIMVIGGPVSSAIMPRLARLQAEERVAEFINVYRESTQLVCIIAGSAAITLTFCAEPLLYAWTGDKVIAADAGTVLMLYASGNGFLSAAAFVYYLQYAKGNLKYHLIGNIGMVLALIPCIIFAASKYGAIGAGCVWLSVNVLYFFFWVAYVHTKIQPGLHWTWVANDVLKIVVPATFTAFIVANFFSFYGDRLDSFIFVVYFALLTLAVSIAASDIGRRWMVKFYKSKFPI